MAKNEEFEVILKGEVGFLRLLLWRLRALVDECPIEFAKSEKGMSDGKKVKPVIRIKAVDPAHVAIVHLLVYPNALTQYKCGGKAELGSDWSIKTKGVRLGMDLDMLADKIGAPKHNKNSDKFRLTFDSKTNKWNLELTKSHLHKMKRFRGLDADGMSDPKVPNLILPAKISGEAFTPDFLYKIISEFTADKVSDHIKIVVTDKKELLIMGDGDSDESIYTIHSDDEIKIDVKEKAHSLFPLDYLGNISSAMKSLKSIADRVEFEMHLGEDYPIRLEMKEYMGSSLVLETKYMLAPRIESE